MLIIANNWKDYKILDAGEGEKLEVWKDVVLRRPDPQIIWKTDKNQKIWKEVHAHYHRSTQGGGQWENKKKYPEKWIVKYKDLSFYIKPTGFKHTGLFPEQAANWDWMTEKISSAGRPVKVLNLFAYTCGFSVAALAGGAGRVVNLDMSRGAISIGQQNHRLNALDAGATFLPHDLFTTWGKIGRGGPYDLIVVDPPSYQKGSFVATKDYARLLRRLPDLLMPGGQVLLCLNAPELGSAFLHDAMREHAPELSFVRRLDNPPVFADVDPERALKVLVYVLPRP